MTSDDYFSTVTGIKQVKRYIDLEDLDIHSHAYRYESMNYEYRCVGK